MAEAFDWIETLSPWWWVAFGIGLGVVEMVTMSFFLIWPGLAAILLAVIVGLSPEMPGEMRIGLFGVLAIGLTFAGRSLMHRFGDGGAPVTAINNRAAQMVGRKAKVLAWDGGEGAVEIDGIRWKARWDGGQVSAEARSVEVLDADGMTLVVRNA